MKLHKVRDELDVHDADLAGSHFDDVNLQQAAFTNVNLREASFSNVNLTNVAIENANLSHMKINGVLVSELFAAYQSRTGAVLFARDLALVREFYQAVLSLDAERVEEDHVVIASPKLQLVIHRIPGDIAATIQIDSPPRPRTETAIKLVLEVANLAAARDLARRHGGELSAPEREWEYQGARVCDGTDPEGNVVQFREQARL